MGSSKVWYGGGQPWIHSMFVEVSSGCVTFRLEARASQMINVSIITAVIEINDPMDDRVFHSV